ncbi:MAG TPA: AAA family ATPase [Terriglobales bacterium]|nr:AAA family ATPase [Terriglobales bacterium]
MSERLKRRKKPADAKEAAKAPEPLQPRFYDDEPAPLQHAAAEAPIAESRRAKAAPEPVSPEPVSTVVEKSAVEKSTAVEASSAARVSRRRRSRGGRGRSRARTAGSTPAPEVAAKLSATEPAGAESSAEEAAVATMPIDDSAAQASPVPSLPVQAPPAQVAAPSSRPSKGTVVLAIGLPGSGKSSWFKRHNIHPLSSDLLRELLFDDAQEQRFQDLVFSNLRSMLKARLIARRPLNYVDATNLTPHDRHSWIKLAKDYGYDVQGVFFDVPLEVCLERHQRRGRVVPEDIMRKMAGKLKPPTFDEGFSKITVVRVKQKEAAAE